VERNTPQVVSEVVSATGSGNTPAVQFLGSKLVWFGSVPDQVKNPTCIVLAGLLLGPDKSPWIWAGLELDRSSILQFVHVWQIFDFY
jgi:hypothetical protein